jgi:hypothetical protein
MIIWLQLRRLVMVATLTSLGSTAVLTGRVSLTGRMIGHVVDVAGGSIGGANIYVRKDMPSDADVKLLTHTDTNGDFTLNLPDGGYDVLVTSPGFDASVKTVAIVHGKPSKFQWELKPHSCSFPGMNCDTFQ